ELHPIADQPAVGFELRFAGAAQSDAAGLPLEVSPAAHQARRQMLELGQLDLELAFGAVGALGEDVENEAHAIDHATIERALEIALLRAGERVIEDHEIRPRFRSARRALGDLAASC